MRKDLRERSPGTLRGPATIPGDSSTKISAPAWAPSCCVPGLSIVSRFFAWLRVASWIEHLRFFTERSFALLVAVVLLQVIRGQEVVAELPMPLSAMTTLTVH